MGRTLKQAMAGLPAGRRAKIKARAKVLGRKTEMLSFIKGGAAARKVTKQPKGLAEADDRTGRSK